MSHLIIRQNTPHRLRHLHQNVVNLRTIFVGLVNKLLFYKVKQTFHHHNTQKESDFCHSLNDMANLKHVQRAIALAMPCVKLIHYSYVMISNSLDRSGSILISFPAGTTSVSDFPSDTYF